MKNRSELINLATEIMTWCMINSCDTFTAFTRYSGHVDQLDIHIHKNGWKADLDPDFRFDFYVKESFTKEGIDYVRSEFQNIKDLKIESDKYNSKETIAENKLKEKKKRLAKVKAEAVRLEKELTK